MTSKIRLLSYHHIPNNGAFLFTYSLQQHWEKALSPDVKTVDHRANRLGVYEFLKRFRIHKKVPLYYWERAALWQKEIRLLSIQAMA